MMKFLARSILGLASLIVLLLPGAALITEADPVASLADPAYPLNHTFDADVLSVGSPPANSDFETAAYTVGTNATNYDLQSAAQDAGVPTNHDFETGSFSGWTTSGTTSIQSDTPHGYYAKLQASATIVFPNFTQTGSPQRVTEGGGNVYAQMDGATLTTAAYTVDATAQFGRTRIYGVDSLNRSQYKIWVLSGAGFGTSTLAAMG